MSSAGLRRRQRRQQPRRRLRGGGRALDGARAAHGRACAGRGGPGRSRSLRRNGLRVALLGFAPYKWANRLEDIGAAKALVREAASEADLVVVAIHAGAEGSAATHVPHGTETFLGENRGDSRRFAHAVIDAGADLVVGFGPARDPRHGALSRPADRVFDRQLRGLQELRHRRHALAQRDPHACELRGDGLFVGGRWISLRLDGDALPHPDPANASAHLVAQLSREDFGAARARDRGGWDDQARDVGSGACHLSPRRGRPRRDRASSCPGGLVATRRPASPAGACTRAPTAAARRRRGRRCAAGACGRSSRAC